MKLKKQFLSLFAVLGLSMAATSAWAAEVQFSTDGGTVSIPQGGNDTVSLADNVTSFKVYNFGGEQTISANTGGTIVLVASNDCIFRVSGSISRAAPEGKTLSVRPTVRIYDGTTNDDPQLISATFNSDSYGELIFKPELTTGNFLRISLSGYRPNNSSSHASKGLDLTIQVLKKNSATAAIDIYRQGDNGYGVAKINGDYAGSDEVSISTAIKVDSIVYNRTFTARTPATIVLPFQLPEGATTNGKFYYLKEVVKIDNNCKWKAIFRNIKLKEPNPNALPDANTPYAVIVEDGSELTFNLNGGKAEFQTATIAEQEDDSHKWIFKGTYEYKTWNSNDDEIGLAYALASENSANYTAGQYVRVGAGAYAYPMRAYVRKVNADVRLSRPLAKGEVSSIEDMPEVIDVEFVDEGEKPMAIGRMNTVTGAIKINRWIDLKGRSTNHKPTTKGVFFNKKGIAK